MAIRPVPPQLPSPVPCPIAFVADCPQDMDVCKGEPLCGPLGQLFNRMLNEAGIRRSECFIGHVFEYRIPEGDIKRWCHKKLPEGQDADAWKSWQIKGAGFLREEHWPALDRLGDEIASVEPKIIVPLGGTALWAFVGHAGISAARGAVGRAMRIVPGAKILPTYHPTFVQHQYKHRVTVVGDLRKALGQARLAATDFDLTARELWLDPDLGDIRRFIDEHLSRSTLITLDIETSMGQITHFGAGADAEHAICIPFADFRQVDRCYWRTEEEEVAAWMLVKEICGLPQPKLFQNGPYDCNWLIRWGIPVVNWREDTRLLHHALYPELPKDLAYMASMYAREGAWKALAELVKSDEKRDS